MDKKHVDSILNSLDAIVYVADMQSHEILYVNEYTKKFFGDLVGQICWQKLQANQSGPCPFCTNDKLLCADGKPAGTYVWEFQNTSNKRWYDVRDKAIEWGDGRLVRLEIATDISWRKEAEAALKKAEEKFRTVADFTYDWEFWLNKSGELEYISPSCERITGFTRDEFMANPRLLLSIIHPDDQFSCANHLQEDLYSREVKHLDFRIISKDGREVWISHSCQPVFSAEGNLLGRRASNRDISKRKETEAALQEARNDLETKVEERSAELKRIYDQLLHAEKLSAVGALSASIAHEFNNPLYGVLSVLEGLKKIMVLGDEEQDMVDMALREGRRMKRLIKGLQDFNRPSSGVMAPVNIHAAMKAILPLLRKEFAARKIILKKELGADLPMINGVEDQLKQVFLNLLHNAATAMPHGGQLAIKTSQEGDMVKIVIQDSGVGIAKDHLSRIFEPFFSTKAATNGTGLGLAVSHGIVKRHGGSIKVVSESGRGSTFTVLIPGKGGAYEKSENHSARG